MADYFEQLCPTHAPKGYRRQRRPYRCPECKTNRLLENPRYDVTVTLTDSNAGAIMGDVTDALRAAGADWNEINEWRRQAMSGTYTDLLRTAMTWVRVTL